MRQTKEQKQTIALESYIKSTSSLPSYTNYCKWCDSKDKNLFTPQTFSKYYWKVKGVDSKTKEGKDLIKFYKDNVKEGDLDLESIQIKDDGIWGRIFGEKDSKLIYALGHYKMKPIGNKLVKDLKSGVIITKDFVMDFDLPIARKMHLYVSKEGVHIRKCDAYIKETFNSKKKFKIEEFRY